MSTETNSTHSGIECGDGGAQGIVWFGPSNDPMKWFRLTITDRSECTIDGKVDEVLEWNDDNTAAIYGHYLTFFMKWDGCSRINFGEENGYIHLCGARSFEKHIFLMTELYRWAEKEIPMQRWVSGEFR